MESAGHFFSALRRGEPPERRRLPHPQKARLADRKAGTLRDPPGEQGGLVVPPLPHPARCDRHRNKQGLPGRRKDPCHGKRHLPRVPVGILLPAGKLEPIEGGGDAPVQKGTGPPCKEVVRLPDHPEAVLPREGLRHLPAAIADQVPEGLYRPVTDRASPREEEILGRIQKLA